MFYAPFSTSCSAFWVLTQLSPTRFERYPEDNASARYGEITSDPYGDRFPDFEYTSS